VLGTPICPGEAIIVFPVAIATANKVCVRHTSTSAADNGVFGGCLRWSTAMKIVLGFIALMFVAGITGPVLADSYTSDVGSNNSVNLP
jgi:hypothetical protein